MLVGRAAPALDRSLTGLLHPSLVSNVVTGRHSPASDMPRVVANQRERFDNDELFRKLSRDMEASICGLCTITIRYDR